MTHIRRPQRSLPVCRAMSEAITTGMLEIASELPEAHASLLGDMHDLAVGYLYSMSQDDVITVVAKLAGGLLAIYPQDGRDKTRDLMMEEVCRITDRIGAKVDAAMLAARKL